MDELVEHWTVLGDLLAGAALRLAEAEAATLRLLAGFAAVMVPLMVLSPVWIWWLFRDRAGRALTYLLAPPPSETDS